MIDYAFHVIIADVTEKGIAQDIPALVGEGFSSIKIFMTYCRLRVDDEKLLDALAAARAAKAMVCVHAENHGIISWMGKRLVEKGYVAPKYYSFSHPRLSESEAFTRLIAFSELLDQPVMIFHVSTREGAAAVRQARGRGVRVF